MQVVVSRSQLHEAFQAVGGVAAQRSPKPILQNVKVVAEKDSLMLLATDLEIGIRQRVDAVKVKEPGEGVLPAARMSMILRESSDEELQITIDEHHCTVSAKDSEYKMLGEDPADFPEVPDFTDEATFSMSSAALAMAIRRTVFSTEAESTRYALNGVFIDVGKEGFRAVATDGRRMALVRHKLKARQEASGIVPAKALSLIERTVQDEEGEVEVALRDNDVLVRTRKAVIFSRLVEGRFPKYQDVLPSGDMMIAEAEAGQWLSAVRRAAILTSEKSRGVNFSFEKNKLVLTSRAAEVGESTIQLPIAYEGTPQTIIFNPQYLSDALRVLPADAAIRFHLLDGQHAAVMHCGDEYLYLVMPLAGQEQA